VGRSHYRLLRNLPRRSCSGAQTRAPFHLGSLPLILSWKSVAQSSRLRVPTPSQWMFRRTGGETPPKLAGGTPGATGQRKTSPGASVCRMTFWQASCCYLPSTIVDEYDT
jgi:hypothetical protein